MDTNWLIATLFIGVIGIALVTYARKQRDAISLIAGVALLAFPYFVHSAIGCIVIAAGIIAAFIVLKVFHIGEF